MSRIRISGQVGESVVDGPGWRYTVFAQGCPHACPGCHNPQTHDPAGGEEVDTAGILERLGNNPLLDGLTLSGGEPFEQAESCAELARGAKALGLNVWVYTGHTWKELMAGRDVRPGWRSLLEAADVVVEGRFVLAQRSLELAWRGSANQRILDMPRSLEAGEPVLWMD